MRPQSFLLLALFLTHPSLLAATGNAAEAPGVPASTFVQTFFGLLLIVALIFGLAWYARKLSGGRSFGQGLVKVIGGVALGPRERIVLVEVGDEWLVIGLVPGQIRTLHTLSKGKLPSDAEQMTNAPPFVGWLKKMAEKRSHDA